MLEIHVHVVTLVKVLKMELLEVSKDINVKAAGRTILIQQGNQYIGFISKISGLNISNFCLMVSTSLVEKQHLS